LTERFDSQFLDEDLYCRGIEAQDCLTGLDGRRCGKKEIGLLNAAIEKLYLKLAEIDLGLSAGLCLKADIGNLPPRILQRLDASLDDFMAPFKTYFTQTVINLGRRIGILF